MSTSSLFSYPTDTNHSCSLYLKPTAFISENSEFSSNSSSFSSFSQYFKVFPPQKPCENPPNLPKNMPTTVKASSNFETDRRFTLKLKEFPENCAKKLEKSAEPKPENQGIRRKVQENGVNFQNFSVKACETARNAVRKSEKPVKTVSFLRCVQGKFKEKLSFRCFQEDQLNFPANINKFLQNTENDDDVETDSETLEYYIKKVRRQLVEAVEEERNRKEALRRKGGLCEKENEICGKNKENREKNRELQGDIKENGLRVVVNK